MTPDLLDPPRASIEAGAEPEIVIRDIRKEFGSTRVLKGASLDIRRGEFVVLLGPSGCGKTTLLRIVSGLETATSGALRIAGRDVAPLSPKERDVAMVFQSYALYPHMRVRDNMSFSLRLAGRPREEIGTRLSRAADILGLGGLLDRYPRELSGGQRQRVSMGRAIIRSPRVFLFDEPLSNLDAQLRVHMRGEIRDLHDRLGTTSIYVTHDQIEAMTMADRVVVMNEGRIEQTGAPLEVFDRPVNRFVAGFIGSPAMNFIPARIERSGGATRARLVDGQLLALGEGLALEAGREVALGLRPHQMRPAPDGALALEVVNVQPTGIETIVLTRLAGTEVLVQAPERLWLTRGAALRVAVEPGSIHVFDATSGQRLEGGAESRERA